jgi:hypothetical protein
MPAMEKMIRFFPDELWKEINVGKAEKRYSISNYGRIISYTDTIETGSLLKGKSVLGYRAIQFKKSVKGKISHKTYYLHKLVAEYFLEKPSEEHLYVTHLDYNHSNNYYKNLKWVTKQQLADHNRNSPLVLKAIPERAETIRKGDGRKLNSTQVMRIKKMLADPKRKTRLKVIAKQFGISEMHLWRIQSGENWGHIQVD